MPLAFLTPHGRPDRAAYAWVRDGGAGAVLELPAGELDTTFRTYQYQYQTLFHHRPIVNGASGYNSALQVFLGSSASPLVEAGYFSDGLRALRQAGVGTVVVHTQAFADAATGASIVELFKREMATGAGTSQVVSEATFPGIVVYRLAEWREAAAAPAGDCAARPGGRFRRQASSPRRATPAIVWSARSTATSRRDGFPASGSPARNGSTSRSIGRATSRACGS